MYSNVNMASLWVSKDSDVTLLEVSENRQHGREVLLSQVRVLKARARQNPDSKP